MLWAWSAGSGAGNQLLEGHKAAVVSAAWSRDGKLIVTGDVDGTVITWDAATFKEKARLALGARIAAVAISPDGKHLAAALTPGSRVRSGAYAEEVFVWETANPSAKPHPISQHAIGGLFTGVASLAFSPDSNSLAVTFCNFAHLTILGDLVGKVRIFSLPADAPKPAAPGYVQDVGFRPDGQHYLVLKGTQAHVHDAKTGKELYSIAAESARFTSDGKRLMVMGPKAVLECDPTTGKVLKEHPRPKTKWGWHLVAFSPDGKRYAAHFGFNVRIYDTATGFEPQQLDNQHEPGSSAIPLTVGKQLVWSPNGKQVAAVGVLVDVGKLGMAGWEVEDRQAVLFLRGRLRRWPARGGVQRGQQEHRHRLRETHRCLDRRPQSGEDTWRAGPGDRRSPSLPMGRRSPPGFACRSSTAGTSYRM